MDIFNEGCEEVGRNYCTPATAYPDVQVGNARVNKYRVPKGHYRMSGVNGKLFYHTYEAGVYMTQLQIKDGRTWHTWMVDDPPQWYAMQKYAAAAYGDVLVGGLGLGLVVKEPCRNKLVKKITVYERNQDVIALMMHHVANTKVNIICGDFIPEALDGETVYDCVISDIWTTSIATKADLVLEVMPIMARMRINRPWAHLDFHGFLTWCDTEVVPKETLEFIKENSEILAGGQ